MYNFLESRLIAEVLRVFVAPDLVYPYIARIPPLREYSLQTKSEIPSLHLQLNSLAYGNLRKHENV